jgi:hypothetical protein
MVCEELKKDLTETEVDVRSYISLSGEYLELRIFKVLMRLLTSGFQTLVIVLGIVFVLLFLSWGAALALCEILNSSYIGFILVGVFYILVTLMLTVARKQMNGALISKFSTFFFDEL